MPCLRVLTSSKHLPAAIVSLDNSKYDKPILFANRLFAGTPDGAIYVQRPQGSRSYRRYISCPVQE